MNRGGEDGEINRLKSVDEIDACKGILLTLWMGLRRMYVSEHMLWALIRYSSPHVLTPSVNKMPGENGSLQKSSAQSP